ncbi:MAG: Hpt domain-containing protein [Gammaproteobacteria bacterium]|nr:Hpt domain-containing protein [Gammaproteobacteria bacterium]
MASAAEQKHDQIIAQLSQEFLTDAGERLDVIEKALGTGDSPQSDALMTIRREVHNLKGMGGSFGFPVVSLIAHRLEDYISGLDALDERQTSDIVVFVDRLQDIVEAGRDPDDSAAGSLVRGLPAHPGAEFDLSDALDVEVLLVSPSKTLSQVATHTLRACGYRVTTARTAWEAIEIAVRAQPDLIITSAVMAGVSGIDLVRVLGVITATEKLPVAVLTSFSRDHQELQKLPSEALMIHLGDTFDDDLAEIIIGLGLA